MIFGAGGRIAATISIGQAANFISQGFGFMNNGNLALDTTVVPAPVSFTKGIAQNATGAAFAVVGQLATDVFVEGIRVSVLGQIVIESADAATFANGNPVTAAGNFAVN